MAGRKKTKDRKQQTLYVDRAHLERMQGGVNKSDIVNTALSIYFNSVDHEERRETLKLGPQEVDKEMVKRLSGY